MPTEQIKLYGAILVFVLIIVVLVQYAYHLSTSISRLQLDAGTRSSDLRAYHDYRKRNSAQLGLFVAAVIGYYLVAVMAEWPSYQVVISAELLWAAACFRAGKKGAFHSRDILNTIIIFFLFLAILVGAVGIFVTRN